jgi:hypothetical protein
MKNVFKKKKKLVFCGCGSCTKSYYVKKCGETRLEYGGKLSTYRPHYTPLPHPHPPKITSSGLFNSF